MRALGWKRTVAALVLFGAAFGYLEAAVVQYLRELHEPARQQFYPGRSPADLFPLLTLDQLRAAGAEQSRALATEIGREAATIVMLGAVALLVSRNAGQWAAAFVIAFGVWDITFYCFLKVLLGWPASLLTWDVLFLIPVPWAAPVTAPVFVSIVMIAAGTAHLYCEERRKPIAIRPSEWCGIMAGAAAIVVSFAMDFRNLLSGGMPHPFHWGIFLAGIAAGIASYARAAGRSWRAGRNAVSRAHSAGAGH